MSDEIKKRGRPTKAQAAIRAAGLVEDIEEDSPKGPSHQKKLSPDELTDNFLEETLKMQSKVKKQLKLALQDCTDPSKLSKIWLDLIEIHDKVRGGRAAGRARKIGETAREIAQSEDRRMLIMASVAKTPSELNEVLQNKVDKPK